MAPGCFTMEQQHDQQQQQFNDLNTSDMLIINESNYDLDNYNITTPTTQPISALNNKTSVAAASEILKHTNSNNIYIFTSYDHEINLDSIPLPSTPYPKNKSALSMRSKLFDTVDSFEILEQTIMKQKRLGRLKNVDLRKKILLKRTFDLVCEIMDHENGFEEEEDTELEEKVVPESDSDDEEDEEESDDSDSSDQEEDDNDNDNSTIQSLPSIQTFTSLETLAQTPSQVDSHTKLLDTNDEMHYINTILNEESLFNYNTVNYSNLSSYSSSTSTTSLKRKLSNNTSLSNISANKKAKIQRRPSNISDEDEEEEEEEEEVDYEENLYDQENFICLYDDDNDPFGIKKIVNSNYSSFKN
jgi:hypothetical protein